MKKRKRKLLASLAIATAIATPVFAQQTLSESIANTETTAKMTRHYADIMAQNGNATMAQYLRHMAQDYSENAADMRLAEQTGDGTIGCANLQRLREIADFQDQLSDANDDPKAKEMLDTSTRAYRGMIALCEQPH